MRILIATVKVPFVRGGAELLAESLETALLAAGHSVDMVQVPFKWYPPELILDQILACRLFDVMESSGTKVDALIGLKFPAYYMRHPNKKMWILHQHRQAYDLWNHPQAGDMISCPNGAEVRDAIRLADRTLIPEARAIFTISKNVSLRLKRFSEVDSTPLYHPPPQAQEFFCREFQDYFFFPSRLNPLKRQSLVLEALALTRNPCQVCFAGMADSPAYAHELATRAEALKIGNRVEFLGGIGDPEKIQRYADCLGVIFPPFDEDYGYVTLEAMLSSKLVVTCSDSGGPNEFVVPETGFIVDSKPECLANVLDTIWENRDRAAAMGRAARDRYQSLDITWPAVVRQLLA